MSSLLPVTLIALAFTAPLSTPTSATLAGLAPAAAAPLAPAALATPLWGPPAICHPIDIGEARSLPWGDGAFELDERYDRATLVADTAALLDTSADLLVHMETLRRAVILTTGLATRYDPSAREKQDDAKALVKTLTARLDHALQTPSPEGVPEARSIGHALFDLGYAYAALAQAGAPLGDDDGHARLLKAARLLADDAAAQLGVVLATCGYGEPNAQTWQHLDKLFQLVEDRSDPWSVRVSKNVTFIVGPFLGLGARDREPLAALARKHHRGA
ncbi:MAG: hypothetical protein DHS20C15_18770 [Planctomycetota bacterium]|nr:MAG: hypothetical protein DHS20C15_18770 [Planctomycetota bacterium]